MFSPNNLPPRHAGNFNQDFGQQTTNNSFMNTPSGMNTISHELNQSAPRPQQTLLGFSKQ